MTARRWAPWIALAVLVVVVIVVAASPGGDRSDADRARGLAAELRCPDCEGLSVAASSTAGGRTIRADIRERVGRGESDADIRQVYVDRYGESILLNPEGSGLGIIVWAVPVVVLVLGAAGLALAMRRWRAQPRMHSTDADEALVAAIRHPEQQP
jgi:cytochrome c-type biogenesis protein CcmH